MVTTQNSHLLSHPNRPEVPTYVESMEGIEKDYDIFFIDMVGVIYDEQTALPGAIPAIQRLIRKNKNIFLLTNNPRPNYIAREKLSKLGFPSNLNIFTSGDATRFYIERKYAGRRVYHLGSDKNKDILKDMDILLAETVHEADFVLITLYIEEDQDPEIFLSTLRDIAASGKEIICANPDIYAFYGKSVRKTAGYFSKIIEKMGAKITYIGKPDEYIYKLLWEKYKLEESNKKRTLMIGDTIETDIRGARAFGIDSLLVLSGNTGHEIKKKNLDPFYYFSSDTQDIVPVYFSERFS